jgi:hypothetical protein
MIMRKLMTPGIAMLALLFLITAGFVQTAQASAIGTSVNLPPGTRQCLGPLPAYVKVYAQGQANSGVRFTVVRNNVQIYQSPSDTTTAFAFSTNSPLQPFYFPGNFQVCARNTGTKISSVLLSLRTDVDAP